jgi:hypothetical protein
MDSRAVECAASRLLLIAVIVAACGHNDATAQRASKTYGHQYQRKNPFHNVPHLSVVNALY